MVNVIELRFLVHLSRCPSSVRPSSLTFHILTSSLKPLNGIQRNLTGSKISMSSTKFVFFGQIGKTRWPFWPLIGWDIFDFFSKPLIGIQRNLTGSKISTSCTSSLAAEEGSGSEPWLAKMRPLPSLCFSGRSGKKDGRPDLWLAETFSTFPLKPLIGIQRNLTESKISAPSSKFVFSSRLED